MTPRRDPVKLSVEVAVYIILAWVAMSVAAWLLIGAGGYLIGPTVSVFSGAVFVNWLMLKIYENRPLTHIGLGLARASWENLALGLAGGAGAACLVLVPPLLLGVARIVPTPSDVPEPGTLLFVAFFLAVGAAGEEILFRGFAFQAMMANLGTWSVVLPTSVIFAAMHSANPDASWLGMANTAGFGALFGYAVMRSRDLWLPIGMHFGWNVTLPLFGVNVSGLRMKVTGYEMQWSAGSLWSGGGYGPEASVLASGAVAAAFLYLWKAPVRRQPAPLLDPPENIPCEPPQPSPS